MRFDWDFFTIGTVPSRLRRHWKKAYKYLYNMLCYHRLSWTHQLFWWVNLRPSGALRIAWYLMVDYWWNWLYWFSYPSSSSRYWLHRQSVCVLSIRCYKDQSLILYPCSTTRPSKSEWLRSLYGAKVETILIDDIATADLEEAMKGEKLPVLSGFFCSAIILHRCWKRDSRRRSSSIHSIKYRAN